VQEGGEFRVLERFARNLEEFLLEEDSLENALQKFGYSEDSGIILIEGECVSTRICCFKGWLLIKGRGFFQLSASSFQGFII
jgi:hypothetical protein